MIVNSHKYDHNDDKEQKSTQQQYKYKPTTLRNMLRPQVLSLSVATVFTD